MKKWLRIAHRGAPAYAPENTLAAFGKALEIGVDGIEFDIHLTRDGEVVVIHDPTLDRTTDLKGAVADLSLEEIRHADAGIKFAPEYRGERVPTLREVLECIPCEIYVFIEVKAIEAIIPAAKIIRKMNRDRVVFISFLTEALKKLQQYDSTFPSALLMEQSLVEGDAAEDARQMLAKARSLGSSALGIYWRIATREFIGEVHRQGGSVWVWALDDPVEIERLVREGVDGIASNIPDRLHFSQNH